MMKRLEPCWQREAQYGLALLGLICVATVMPPAASAQVSTDPIGQSVREPALSILDQLDVATAGFTRGQVSYKLLLIPNFTAVEGTNIYGATVGLKINEIRRNMALQLRGIGKNIDTEPASRNRFGFDAKLTYADTTPLSAALKGTFLHTADLSDRTEGEIAVDYRLHKGQFHALKTGVTARYASTTPEIGDKQSGSVFAAGVTWALGAATEINAAYEFENDLAGEDNFSVTIGQVLPQLPWSTVLIVTAAKHRVIAVNLALSF